MELTRCRITTPFYPTTLVIPLPSESLTCLADILKAVRLYLIDLGETPPPCRPMRVYIQSKEGDEKIVDDEDLEAGVWGCYKKHGFHMFTRPYPLPVFVVRVVEGEKG
ncbi:hypothetical protein HDV00_006610 [Rhizophlyctis rosea]|nr:hypothetical protein HDV00_006610 [Rhizophlyctis rosea]